MFYVLRWEGDGGSEDPLYAARKLYVPLEAGQIAPVEEQVVKQFQAEVEHYPAGLYRIYPSMRVIDVTVTSTVAKA